MYYMLENGKVQYKGFTKDIVLDKAEDNLCQRTDFRPKGKKLFLSLCVGLMATRLSIRLHKVDILRHSLHRSDVHVHL